jgi:hypothetical protein
MGSTTGINIRSLRVRVFAVAIERIPAPERQLPCS